MTYLPPSDALDAAAGADEAIVAGFLGDLAVAEPGPSPLGDGLVHHVQALLQRKLGGEVLVRTRSTLVPGPGLAVQPDVAVLPGRNSDYLVRHPVRAHLVVEIVAETPEGRGDARAEDAGAADAGPEDAGGGRPEAGLDAKLALYARAGVPVCWIVDAAGRSVECRRMPDRAGRLYRQSLRAAGGDRLALDAYPEAWIEARELFPDDTGR